MSRTSALSRRTVLRGLGTAVALPSLEAMLPRRARADAAPAPRRFLAMFGLMNGYVGRFDATQGTFIAPWSAPAAGPLQNNSFLEPFFSRGIASKLTNLVGLSDRAGAGAHALAHGDFLTATRPACNTDLDALLPTGVDVYGPTADQIAAGHLRQFTTVPSLCLDEGYKYVPQGGFAPYEMNLSWKSGTEPIAADNNPRDVFDRLFAGYDPTASAAAVAQRRAERKSVLDFVNADARGLLAKLSRSDVQKVEQYLDSVRELELRVDAAEVPPTAIIGSRPEEPASSAYFGNANRSARQLLLQDLIVKAFETDRTRVAVLRTSGGGDWLSRADGSLVGNDHHVSSHWDQGATPAECAERRENMDVFTRWSLAMYADLLAKLDAIVDPDGSTALDNTVAMFGGEVAASHQHTYASMAALIGGRGGKRADGRWAIAAGREVRFGKWLAADHGEVYPPAQLFPGERNMKDLLWGMLRIVGVPNLTGFGDARVPLDTELG